MLDCTLLQYLINREKYNEDAWPFNPYRTNVENRVSS